jgi:hypothetical protein
MNTLPTAVLPRPFNSSCLIALSSFLLPSSCFVLPSSFVSFAISAPKRNPRLGGTGFASAILAREPLARDVGRLKTAATRDALELAK